MFHFYRNFLKEHHLFHKSDPYFGPDECIDDRVQRKYLNNPEVGMVWCYAVHHQFIIYSGSESNSYGADQCDREMEGVWEQAKLH